MFLWFLFLKLIYGQDQNVYTPISAAFLGQYKSETTFLDLNQGRVRGLRYPDLGIEIFYGIPFAKPVNRFEHSEVLDIFQGSGIHRCYDPVFRIGSWSLSRKE